MLNPQVQGVKKGVMLINTRVVIPDGSPGVDKVEQIVYTPFLRSVTFQEENWQFTGSLEIKITYLSETPRSRGVETGRLVESSGNQDFYDDGFSDCDEFAEEEAVRIEDKPGTGWLYHSPAIHSFADVTGFTGQSPALHLALPEVDQTWLRVMDVEVKVRDQRTLDISAVVRFEDQEGMRENCSAGEKVLEFEYPLALPSWPPGMADILEWQAGFREGVLQFNGTEMCVNGELILQVICVEKEAGEREFSVVNTKSPMFWRIPLPTGIDPDLIMAVNLEIKGVREESDGLVVNGVLFVDVAIDSLDEDILPPGEPIAVDFVQDGTLDLPEGFLANKYSNEDPSNYEESPNEGPFDENFSNEDFSDESLSNKDFSNDDLFSEELFNDDSAALESLAFDVDKETIPGGNGRAEKVSDEAGLTGRIAKVAGISPKQQEPRELGPGPAMDVEGFLKAIHGEDQARNTLGLFSGDMDSESHDLLRSLDLALQECDQSAGKPMDMDQKETNESNQREVKVVAPDNRVPRFKLGFGSQTEKTAISKAKLSTSPQNPGFPKPDNYSGCRKSTGTWTAYLVKPKDTLTDICARYGINPEVVRERNGLDGVVLKAGTMLWIPRSS